MRGGRANDDCEKVLKSSSSGASWPVRFLDVDEEQPWDKKSLKLRWFSILRPTTEKERAAGGQMGSKRLGSKLAVAGWGEALERDVHEPDGAEKVIWRSAMSHGSSHEWRTKSLPKKGFHHGDDDTDGTTMTRASTMGTTTPSASAAFSAVKRGARAVKAARAVTGCGGVKGARAGCGG
jgi:hypothetical protein